MRKWHTHTTEYYPATRKENILPFATTEMDPEGIMQCEVSQIKTGKCYLPFSVESEKCQTKNTVKWWLPGDGGVKTGVKGLKPTSSSK